jgi:hypothetical protein
MPGPLFTNNASATLAGSYTATATAITLTAGQGALFPAPGAGEWFMATVVDNLNNIEIIKCTARTSDTLTVLRGQEGTPARPFGAGEKLENRLTAGALHDIKTGVLDPAQVPNGFITGPMLAPLSITQGKLADGCVTTPKILDGNVTASKLAAGAALSNLGYTPIQQGGGVAQTTDKVFIGWSAANMLRLTVGSTDLGFILNKVDDGSVGSAGYRALPINDQNANYTLGLVDQGGSVVHTTGSHAYVVPPDSVPLNRGTIIHIVNRGGTLNINPYPGVTLTYVPGGATGGRILAAPGVATVEKLDPSNWIIYGAGLT